MNGLFDELLPLWERLIVTISKNKPEQNVISQEATFKI